MALITRSRTGFSRLIIACSSPPSTHTHQTQPPPHPPRHDSITDGSPKYHLRRHIRRTQETPHPHGAPQKQLAFYPTMSALMHVCTRRCNQHMTIHLHHPFNLVSFIPTQHPTLAYHTWFSKSGEGHAGIDHILIAPDCIHPNSTCGVDHEISNRLFKTDHRLLFATIDTHSPNIAPTPLLPSLLFVSIYRCQAIILIVTVI